LAFEKKKLATSGEKKKLKQKKNNGIRKEKKQDCPRVRNPKKGEGHFEKKRTVLEGNTHTLEGYRKRN